MNCTDQQKINKSRDFGRSYDGSIWHLLKLGNFVQIVLRLMDDKLRVIVQQIQDADQVVIRSTPACRWHVCGEGRRVVVPRRHQVDHQLETHREEGRAGLDGKKKRRGGGRPLIMSNPERGPCATKSVSEIRSAPTCRFLRRAANTTHNFLVQRAQVVIVSTPFSGIPSYIHHFSHDAAHQT